MKAASCELCWCGHTLIQRGARTPELWFILRHVAAAFRRESPGSLLSQHLNFMAFKHFVSVQPWSRGICNKSYSLQYLARHLDMYPCIRVPCCLQPEGYLNPLKQGPYSPNRCVWEVPDIWVNTLCNQQTGAGAGAEAAPGFIVVVSFKMQHSKYVEYVSIS